MNHFEQAIEVLLQRKFKVQPQYRTNWVGIFGNRIRVDFLCEKSNKEKLCIEVKFQESKGTAEQKLCFAYQQIVRSHEIPTYLLVAGTGWSKGALAWILEQEKSGNYSGCFTMDSFFEWLKTN